MTNKRQNLGQAGEQLATKLLKTKNYRILKTNLRTKIGEIDILARDGQTLVIVEVKTKTGPQFGSALEMITPAKQRKLVLLTQELQMTHQTERVRVDVVAIDQAGDEPLMKHYRGIIEYHA